jgi:hypothetical protein
MGEDWYILPFRWESSGSMTYSYPPQAERSVGKKRPAWLLAAFALSVLIAIAVVVRRTLTLISSATASSARVASIDATFAAHKTLTLLHILPAAAFVLVATTLFLGKRRSISLKRAFYVLGAWTGFSAFAMNAYAIGGWTERSAVIFFNTLFLACLLRAWLSEHSRATEEYLWMLRAVAILLGIATTRPVMGVFFATQSITHLRPEQFFGIAFWIGFSFNTIAVELWLRSSRPERPLN